MRFHIGVDKAAAGENNARRYPMRNFPNRKSLLSAAAVIGAGLFSASASAAVLTALPAADNPTTKVVTIGVLVADDGRYAVPVGDVVFSESGHTLGVVSTRSSETLCPGGLTFSCIFRLALAPGFPTGRHTITATYTRDQPGGPAPPESLTFTVYVSELAWLPAVLGLLSD
jgi:hypothetical protein